MGLEGRQTFSPFGRIDGLAVVMGIKHQGAGGAGAQHFAIHRRDRSRYIHFNGAGIADAAFFHHLHDEGGVLTQLFGVVPGIGQGAKLGVLVEEFVVAVLVATADFLDFVLLSEGKQAQPKTKCNTN